ncbi:Crp/Fnr family transcriptional regulator [Actinomadura sp. WMMB 499]|uniref:Crp/Fnr family transcriptional regulator n=1 Tax=Actinomadura sp. WMMB 499 TaxID=1219491 RepID=UPI00159D3728|nr:Crp/Fnr family transcriptional regulator [Actinomadura sp. WMMB 499]
MRPFFFQLRSEEQRDLVESGTVRRVPAGTRIHAEGQRSTTVAVLLSAGAGVVRDADGGARPLAYRGPGDILGELSFIDGRPHSATVRVTRPGRVVLLSHEAFDRVRRRHEGVRNALLRVLAHRLRSADMYRVAGQGRVPVRVARLLDHSGDLGGPPREAGPPIRYQREIADLLGVSRSSVVRALSDLRARGIVATGHGTVRVVDPGRLARFLECPDAGPEGA